MNELAQCANCPQTAITQLCYPEYVDGLRLATHVPDGNCECVLPYVELLFAKAH